jgi:hypothetical protein
MYTPILVSNDHIVQELYLHLEVAPVLLTSSRFLENNGSTLFSVRTETTRTSTMNISFSPTSRVIRRNLDSGATLLDTWGIKWRKGCHKIIFISVSNHMCYVYNSQQRPCMTMFLCIHYACNENPNGSGGQIDLSLPPWSWDGKWQRWSISCDKTRPDLLEEVKPIITTSYVDLVWIYIKLIWT